MVKVKAINTIKIGGKTYAPSDEFEIEKDSELISKKAVEVVSLNEAQQAEYDEKLKTLEGLKENLTICEEKLNGAIEENKNLEAQQAEYDEKLKNISNWNDFKKFRDGLFSSDEEEEK